MLNSPEFHALRREYLRGSLERCPHLEAEAARLRQGEPVDLKLLRQEVHRFRGSGGFYGFPGITASSATAEDLLIQVIDGQAKRDDQNMAALVEMVSAAVRAAAVAEGL